MTNITQDSFVYVVFNLAGILFIGAVILLLGYLSISWLRAGSRGRRVLGQEIIWTLVPALIVLGLAIVSEIPRRPERTEHPIADGQAKVVPR
jgi:membrane protein DedA with SNARE-associated domain